jgi:DNA-binding response OmpR family regulator
VIERDRKRGVLAEDDVDRAREMQEILETVGGYDVWLTKRRAEVIKLLDDTNARWVILDLNLQDGNAGEIVPDIRDRFGSSVIIVVLSGYYEDYPEYELLAKGADLYLRKPYDPKALLQQMETLLARMEGKEMRRGKGLKLEFGGGLLDVDRGVYTKGRSEVTIPEMQMKLIRRLVAARDEQGWQYVERGELVVHVWGKDYDQDPLVSVERVRRVRSRLRDTLGIEMIESRWEGTRHIPKYRLSGEVKLVE